MAPKPRRGCCRFWAGVRLRTLQLAAAVVIVLGFTSEALAGSITLAWDPSPGSAGYIVVYGTTPGVYPYAVAVGNHTFATVNGLASGVTYYFAVRAYSTLGDISTVSNEVAGSAATNAPPVFNDPGPQQTSEGIPV